MRIALVITELYPGGAEKCFVNLACFLKSAGHDVSVWQLWPSPPGEKAALILQLELAKIPTYSLEASRARHLPRLVLSLRRQLSQFAPDLVQAFLFHANFVTALAVGRKTYGFFGGARVRQPERIRQWLQRWAAGKMEKLICVSESVAAHCANVEKIPRDKLLVIPNGIHMSNSPNNDRNANTVSWRQFELPDSARVVLFVGRLTDQKGIEACLREADSWLLEMPKHTFVVMGEGELEDQLRTLAHGLQSAGRIKFVGWQPNPQQWMKISEMILLPAKYEGMPNVLLEAMAVGRPFVSFDVEGVVELLGKDPSLDHQLAIEKQLVPQANFAQLAQSIRRLGEDRGLQEACGETNRQRIHEHFQLELQLRKYLHAYQHFAKMAGKAC